MFRKAKSEFVRKDVGHFNFQLVHNRFELVKSEVTLPHFEPVKHRVGETGDFGEFGIGQRASLFSQEFRQLRIQAFSHWKRLAKKTSPMVDDMLDLNFGGRAESRHEKPRSGDNRSHLRCRCFAGLLVVPSFFATTACPH